MKEYFAGKTAIVTGGTAGVGLALVEQLLKYGAAEVVLAGRNSKLLGEQERRLSEKYPGRVKAIRCDVTNKSQVEDLIAQSAKYFGSRIDLLVNNAGEALLGWFDDLTDEDWQAAFDLHFYGPLWAMQAVIPMMKQQGSGQIVNVISGAVFTPIAQQSRYAASKAALHTLTMALRAEYWDDNIKFSSASPGITVTEIFGDFQPPQGAKTPKQAAKRILRGVAENSRIILIDKGDKIGGRYGNNPDAQSMMDAYGEHVTRERHNGNLGY